MKSEINFEYFLNLESKKLEKYYEAHIIKLSKNRFEKKIFF
jgi:hypothetical protein